MRRLIACMLAMAACVAQAQSPRIVAVVAPAYPAAAAQRGEMAIMDLEARLNPDGTIAMPSLKASGGSEAFVAAIREVAPLWVFQPAIDPVTCESRADDLRMRVWFEQAGGQPKVSVSLAPAAAAPATGPVTRRAGKLPFYPKAAQQQGIEGEIFAVAKVDVTGRVWNVHLRPGLNKGAFAAPVHNALMKWEFDVAGYPAGRPHVCIEVPVEFKLRQSRITGESGQVGPLVRLP